LNHRVKATIVVKRRHQIRAWNWGSFRIRTNHDHRGGSGGHLLYRRGPCRGRLRPRPSIAVRENLVSRDAAHVRVRFREGDRGRTRSEVMTMGSEESGPRRYRRHGGACLRRVRLRRIQQQKRAPPTRRPATPQLACVERCSREASADRPQLHVDCRRRPRATRTSPHPDKPGWWRGSGRRTLGLVLNTAPRWPPPRWPSEPGSDPRGSDAIRRSRSSSFQPNCEEPPNAICLKRLL
jgi:hypothetical protein